MLGPVAVPVLSVKDRPEPFTTVVLPAASLDVRPALLILVLPVVTEPLVPRSIFRANLINSVSVPSETTPILPSVNTALVAVFPLIFNVSSSLRVIVAPVSPSNLIPFVVTAVLAASAVVFTSNNWPPLTASLLLAATVPSATLLNFVGVVVDPDASNRLTWISEWATVLAPTLALPVAGSISLSK